MVRSPFGLYEIINLIIAQFQIRTTQKFPYRRFLVSKILQALFPVKNSCCRNRTIPLLAVRQKFFSIFRTFTFSAYRNDDTSRFFLPLHSVYTKDNIYHTAHIFHKDTRSRFRIRLYDFYTSLSTPPFHTIRNSNLCSCSLPLSKCH